MKSKYDTYGERAYLLVFLGRRLPLPPAIVGDVPNGYYIYKTKCSLYRAGSPTCVTYFLAATLVRREG